MRIIDLQTWPRRKHFEVYRAFDYPHFGLCANMDVTRLLPLIRERGLSHTISVVYLLARAANTLPEFRLRIRGETVVEHDVVHPSPTILTAGELFSFCTMPYAADFAAFNENAQAAIARVKANPTLEDEPGQDNLLFMTGIPWVSFTNMLHPIHMHPADSVPRLAWGKFFNEGAQVKMPLAVQVNHALMDGVHVGRYYELVQSWLDAPQEIIR